jgi:hypothetical protein
MTRRDTCRAPSCDRAPGQQDREDYRAGRFCSVQCDVRFEHIRADAREAARDAAPDPEPAPGRRP